MITCEGIRQTNTQISRLMNSKSLVLWCCGVVVLWCCGVVVLCPWCYGVVVLWQLLDMVSTYLHCIP